MWQVSGSAQSSTQFWPRAVGSFITIAWDPSPDPSVIGYVVYVGTQSRTYLGAYNVGNRTSFVYPYASVNRRHFFAVAAYSSSLDIGGLSDEVSGFGRIVPPAGYVPDFTTLPLGNGGFYGRCAAGIDGCLESAVVSASAGRISALTSSAEGQVWFVEDKQRIFTIDVDGTVNRIERTSGRNRGQVDGLAIDPRFRQTRHVYVQEIERLGDGSRELIISRYRAVRGTLRERAVIVSGIRLPPTGSTPFTVDGNGRIFVAVPGEQHGARPLEGVVFAVQPDGRYVKGPSGLPLSWRGLSNPSGLVWAPGRRELWVSGADDTGKPTVERLPLNPQPEAPHSATAPRFLLVPAPGGRLLRLDRHAARAAPVLLGSGESVTAISGTGQDVVFAATHSNASGSRIVVIPMAD